jgi:GNAT superfamily N-acetyltransferase
VISVRPVLTEQDIDTYVEIRTRVHPENPMPREVVVDDRARPDHLDLIAERDGVPVGVASTSKFGGAPDGEYAYLTIRVPAEERGRGVGTALHRRASEHARSLGKSRFYAVVRDVDADSLGYYAGRGFGEIGRMQDVVLDVAAARGDMDVPAGIAIAPLTADRERGAYAVALEADPDIPSGEPLVSGSFEQWHGRHLGPLLARDLSFVALDGEVVVGFALAGRFTDDTFQHWMTGVARQARGRGIARALKQAQIAAAKSAGIRFLRTQNDLSNAPMRRVNERLGYERRFEWVHLAGPLLD